MINLSKMNITDKDNYCHRIYQKDILETSEFLVVCDDLANILRIFLPIACYTNFRDALFHFRRMVRAYEVNEIMCQAFAVKEHTKRAKTDAALYLLRRFSDIALYMIQNHERYKILSDIQIELQDKANIMGECISNYRLSGMMFSESKYLKISYEKGIALIIEYLKFINLNLQCEFKNAVDEIRKSNRSRNNEEYPTD